MNAQDQWILRLIQAVPSVGENAFRVLLTERPPHIWVPDCLWHTSYLDTLKQLANRTAREGRVDLLRILVDEFHASVDRNTLKQSLMSGHLESFELVFDRLHPPEKLLSLCELRTAAGSGYLPLCERLVALGVLKGGKVPVDALGLPAQRGDLAMLQWLLDRGADPNESNWLSGTPLIRSLSCHQSEAVNLLLLAGANPDQAHLGRYPLQIAIELGDSSSVKALVASGSHLEQRFSGIEVWSDSEMHPSLLSVSGREDTPLLRALRHGHMDIAIYLLEAGADSKAVNADKESASALLAKLPVETQKSLGGKMGFLSI